VLSGEVKDEAMRRLAAVTAAEFPAIAEPLEREASNVACLNRRLMVAPRAERATCCQRALPALERHYVDDLRVCALPNSAFEGQREAMRFARAYHSFAIASDDQGIELTRAQAGLAACSDVADAAGVPPSDGSQPQGATRLGGVPRLEPGTGGEGAGSFAPAEAGRVDQ
jgi:hypothetical protein